MSKKTLSLKEFYESHGSSKGVSTYNSLPVRPRSDRDDDQGLHLGLAHDCLLDSGRAYPQRYGLVKEGHYAEVGSYGKHGGSSDGAPVGDVDYYRPTGPHQYSSGTSSGYYAHRQGPRGPSGPHDRPAQQSCEPAGGYPQHRGHVSPSGMPAAGGPAAAAGMGGPAHGGMHGSNAAGPGYGRGPQYAFGPSTGSYGLPPQHAYPAPPGRAMPGVHYGPGGVATCSESVLPMRPPPMAFGPGNYGPRAGPYGTPPPPPPPRPLPAQQQEVGDGPTARIPAMDSTATAGDSRHASGVQPVPESPAAPTARPANTDALSKLAREPAIKPAVAAEKATPFAAAKGSTDAVTEPAAPAGPKNEFAERLAQRAMASAARAKSSLLAGGSSGNLSRDGSLALASAQGTAVSPLDIPSAPAAADADSNESSPSDHQGVFVRPAHPFGRPKLALKPRAAPLDGPAQGSGNYSSTSSDSGDTPAEHGSSSTSSSVSSGRPRLHLLPRGSSLSADSPRGVSTAAATSTRKASVFGEAKPREEVLKGRGLDPFLVDSVVAGSRKSSESITGRQGSFGDKGSRLAGAHSGGDDGWHTVSGHGRKGANAERDGRLPELDGFDPFFSSTKVSSGYVAVPPASTFSRDIMRVGGSKRCGGYGSPGGRAGGFGVGGREEEEEEDDAAVFRRALPTRQQPLAL